MATVSYPTVDQNGNFTSGKVLDRLRDIFGAGGGGSSASQLTATADTTTAEVNTWLGTTSPLGVKRLAGDLNITAPLVVPSGCYLEATGATITLAPGTGGNMLQNAAVSAAATRDKDITVIGGTWVRGENGGVGRNLHTLVFRRIDGLRLSDYTVDTNAGKYCVSIADATDFHITNSTFVDTFSDGIHIQGPASNFIVEKVRGTTHDDSVAITGNDYEAYADVSGNVTNGVIRDVHTTSGGANNVKVLAGQGFTVDDITVEHVRGKCAQHGVWLGDDNGQARTDNGTHGRLIVKDVDTEGGQASSAQVYANLGLGARELILEDVVLRRGLGTYAVYIGADNPVDTLRVVRPTIDGLSGRKAVRLVGGASTAFTRLDIASPTIRATGGITSVLDTSVKLGNVTITGVHLTTTDTNDTRWVLLGGGSPDTLTISGGYVSGGRDLLDLTTGGNYLLTGGLTVAGINRIANLYAGTPVITFGDATIISTINNFIMLNSGTVGVVVLGGENTAFPATPNVLQRASATMTYRVNGRKMRVPLADLTPTTGDQATAVFTTGAIPAGHQSVYTGTVWRSMIDGTTSA